MEFGVTVSTEDSKSFSLGSNPRSPTCEISTTVSMSAFQAEYVSSILISRSMITFKYKDTIISTPNLEKKLKRMKITLQDIEILPEEVKVEEPEDDWKRPLIRLKSSLDNYVYSIYSEVKPENPTELIKNLIWNPDNKTGVKGFTEEYAKTLVYV